MEIEEEKKNKELNKESALSLDELLEILGNPTRRVILSKLAKVPLSTSELANALDISRQAVHSQLKFLSEDYPVIEEIQSEKGPTKYRIKSNISLRVDISPDYYNIKYNMSDVQEGLEKIQLKEADLSGDYRKIQDPKEKIKFLGENIKKNEKKIKKLEIERETLLQDKKNSIVELKNIMAQQFEKDLVKEYPSLEKEIFYTLFFNIDRYFDKINIDYLLNDLFFADMNIIRRDQHRVSIKHLLKDLSKIMDFFREDKDDWFFDI